VPFVDVLPVARAAISLLGDPFGVETLCASDGEAARIAELQLDLGEGPAWDALAKRGPVLAFDIRNDSSPAWPMFSAALRGSSSRGVFSFPLYVGALGIGAIDLYTDRTDMLTSEQIDDAAVLADIAAHEILRRSLALHPSDADNMQHSRREMHQATGMVIAQLSVSAEDALMVIRGYAFSSGRTVRDVASDITARRIDMSLR